MKSSKRTGRSKAKPAAKRRTAAGRGRGGSRGGDEARRGTELVDRAALETIPEEDEATQARRTADSMAGDEDPGGAVAVPEHDSVDEWASALGVERSPDSPVRSSEEILTERDRRRPGTEPAGE
jgi:hypothetical protein